MKVLIVEDARNSDLVTLAKLKRSLGIEVTTYDDRLRDIIADVSSAVVAYCGKTFARSLVTEHLPGYGDETLMVDRTPIIRIDELRHLEDVVSVSGYTIYDPDAGLIRNEDGYWDDTRRIHQWITAQRSTRPGAQEYEVDYYGGYLMPNDSFTASGIMSALASDGSFNLPGYPTEWWPLLVSGERIQLSGFSNAGNNGLFTVLSRTQTKLVTNGTLVDETPSGIVTVNVRLHGNTVLPQDLERIVIGEVRNRYLSEQRDGTIKSEKIGDWSATYGGSESTESDASGFSPVTSSALRLWQRAI